MSSILDSAQTYVSLLVVCCVVWLSVPPLFGVLAWCFFLPCCLSLHLSPFLSPSVSLFQSLSQHMLASELS